MTTDQIRLLEVATADCVISGNMKGLFSFNCSKKH